MRSHRFRDIPSHLSSQAKSDCFSTLILFNRTSINVRATVRSSTTKTISRYCVNCNFVFSVCRSVCESLVKSEALILAEKWSDLPTAVAWFSISLCSSRMTLNSRFKSLSIFGGSYSAISKHYTFLESIRAWKSIRSDSWCSGVPHE